MAWNVAVSRGRRQGAAGALRQVDEANVAAKADRDRTEAKAANEDDDALRRELRRYSPVILAIVALGMGGCATVPTGGPGRGGAFCDVERPIALSEAAITAMAHDELARAVAHNRHGERQCGWKPARRAS